MFQTLKKAMSDGRYYSIYTNINDTTKFNYGKIISVDAHYFAIYSIAPNGCYDGIIVKETDSVYRLECDDNYSMKMNKLIDKTELPNSPLIQDDKSTLIMWIDYIIEHSLITTIEVFDSGMDDVVGIIVKKQDNLLTIRQIDSYGIEDGYSVIKMVNITQLSFDSETHKSIYKLYNTSRI